MVATGALQHVHCIQHDAGVSASGGSHGGASCHRHGVYRVFLPMRGLIRVLIKDWTQRGVGYAWRMMSVGLGGASWEVGGMGDGCGEELLECRSIKFI